MSSFVFAINYSDHKYSYRPIISLFYNPLIFLLWVHFFSIIEFRQHYHILKRINKFCVFVIGLPTLIFSFMSYTAQESLCTLNLEECCVQVYPYRQNDNFLHRTQSCDSWLCLWSIPDPGSGIFSLESILHLSFSGVFSFVSLQPNVSNFIWQCDWKRSIE